MDEKDKPLFTIGVAARLLGVHPQTLRLYEREGLISPSRTEGNTRLYSQRDIEDVRTIMHLTREVGVNLAGVELIVGVRRRFMQISIDMGETVDRLMHEMEREMVIRAGMVAPATEGDVAKKRESKVMKIKIEKG
ncbi:MAG: helix-turn-helix transcriptional regulator [Nitrospirae bacterium]|nr:helix-turn-helix transcriptional regulator [Nitrospirota bacterium]